MTNILIVQCSAGEWSERVTRPVMAFMEADRAAAEDYVKAATAEYERLRAVFDFDVRHHRATRLREGKEHLLTGLELLAPVNQYGGFGVDREQKFWIDEVELHRLLVPTPIFK